MAAAFSLTSDKTVSSCLRLGCFGLCTPCLPFPDRPTARVGRGRKHSFRPESGSTVAALQGLRGPILFLLLAFALAGCVRPHPTGYFPNYAGLANQPTPCFTVYAERMPAAGKEPRLTHVLQVVPARWNALRLAKPFQEKDLLEMLDDDLIGYLLQYRPPAMRVTRSRNLDMFVNLGANVTQVQVAITDVSKGVAILRPMFGGMFLGATRLQVEGQLVDLRTQTVLARFARRTLGKGTAYGLPTPQSLSPRFCWRLSMDETTDLLARYIVRQLEAPPANWLDAMLAKKPQ